MYTVMVPKSLLEKFSWDEARREYFTLIPNGPVSLSGQRFARFRVEFRPEGYAVIHLRGIEP